ncbi:hypothetical protein PF005_g3214 [Phytophthora fragariae]|uniref:Secreted protein n=1 Tax=Phytophthora fragariae TaxID=53985 RepID=A0A6A3TCV7_9STRA|nr:hypothetical protein PF003_g17544 [Phytophthora fragariae]KAE8947784.1 hypothetical protein PF009_g2621 [Phytophthora fragariae]KAE9028783.1 hypothetical protein PF011_g1408 [Phytophthora fragariae]KAE9133581.1 hypothetical protein PF010_g2759 [Phytophthora fragariae]KAE9133974.1 hypothetical protein PF007_g3132 [Phytophthora fragariae]
MAVSACSTMSGLLHCSVFLVDRAVLVKIALQHHRVNLHHTHSGRSSTTTILLYCRVHVLCPHTLPGTGTDRLKLHVGV